MTTAAPYTEQDIADMRDDLNMERRALERLEDAMPLPGRESEWAARVRATHARLQEMEREYEAAVAGFVDFGDAA